MNNLQHKRPLIVSILLANLVLLLATLVFKWEAIDVFALYIIETIIIGGYHLLKLIIIAAMSWLGIYKVDKAPKLSGFFLIILFFVFHFGLFIFVQTVLVLPSQSESFINNFLSLADYVKGENIGMVFLFLIANLVLLMKYFLIDRVFKTKTYNEILMEPYPRIFVQQFVVIIGGGIMMFLDAPMVFVVFFILIKTLIELAVSINGGIVAKVVE